MTSYQEATITFKTLFSEKMIEDRIDQLADQIAKDYQSSDHLVIICVLNGAFIFCSDLCRALSRKGLNKISMDFLSVSSYGDSTVSSGNIKVNLDIANDIDGKDVLIVEDIVDTGLTMSKLFDTIHAKAPNSIKLASLLYKPSRSEHKVKIDYLAFTIEDQFVIGYGLDYAGKYRELPLVAIYDGE